MWGITIGTTRVSSDFLAAGFRFYASWQGRGSFLETPMAQFDRSLRSQAKNSAIAARPTTAQGGKIAKIGPCASHRTVCLSFAPASLREFVCLLQDVNDL